MAYPRNDEMRMKLKKHLRSAKATPDVAKAIRADEAAVRGMLRVMRAEGTVFMARAKTNKHRAGVAVWGLTARGAVAAARRYEAADPPRQAPAHQRAKWRQQLACWNLMGPAWE